MEFEWDEAKRLANAEKHALDFGLADVVFDGRPQVTWSSSYPAEPRYTTVVQLDDGRFVTTIWTQRDTRTRIISLRRSRDEEKRRYRDVHG